VKAIEVYTQRSACEILCCRYVMLISDSLAKSLDERHKPYSVQEILVQVPLFCRRQIDELFVLLFFRYP